MPWLLKTEPSTYSFADLERERRAVWDGVTNPVALKHLRAMAPGDEAFIYHTGDQKQVVGIARVTRAAYPDPKASDPRLVVVDLVPVRALPAPVTLAAIKADHRFAALPLVRQPRLSVMPVPEPLWDAMLALADPGSTRPNKSR
jgi:predicted RNA-binding protein with PUA-like domain